MEENTQVYEVTHSSPEFKTVADYIRDVSSPAAMYVDSMSDFLSVLQSDGATTNRQAIESRFTKKWEIDKYVGKNLPASELPLVIGTKLAIPRIKINRAGLMTEGIEVVSNNIPAFKARALAELEREKRYRPVSKPINGGIEGITKEEYPDLTVWMWCRALSSTDDNEGQIFNITPFIQKATTNVDKNGGNWQLSLPPLVCELKGGKWVIKKNSLKRYQNSAKASLQGDDYLAEGNLFKLGQSGELKRNQFLFHNIISPNDMIWIRFETLDMEKEQRLQDNKDFYIDKSNLAGRVYDMIGLVDTNSQSVTPESNDVSITVSGRDLSKLFIEDGSYFFPIEMAQGKLNFAGGTAAKNSLMQRVFSQGALQYFGLYYNNSIEKVLKFVIQQLSTIKIVPNDLFSSYGERRNKSYVEEGEKFSNNLLQTDRLATFKDKAKKAIEKLRNTAEFDELSPSSEIREQESIWDKALHFMKAIREKKVRTKGGTVTLGWEAFEYIDSVGRVEAVEQNTLPKFFHNSLHLTLFYTKNQVVRGGEKELFIAIDAYIDSESSNIQNKDTWTEDYAPGIWQIVKLVIDEGVTQRRVVDSSMSSANGSLLNYIRKVCQEPFVEFYMDTYGDTFNLIVRKPPYDKNGILSMLDGSCRVEKEEGKDEFVVSTVIDVEMEDVLKEELGYDDKGAITWYHLEPQASFIGNSSTFSLAYLPSIFFEEYADIWGSKPLQCVHNYIPNMQIDPQANMLNVCELQAFEDLRYMVESNAYLPFTRRGSLTLSGDRRLKYGNIIRYKSTGEIFFVEQVQQTASINESSIDRSTTIQVSRGMREPLINGVVALDKVFNQTQSLFSYFNLINTELNIKATSVTETVTKTTETKKKKTEEASSIDLFSIAQQYEGYAYEWGKTGEGRRIDCSGFVSKVLKKAGVKTARVSEEIMKQSNNFRPVPFFDAATLRAGDVIGLATGKGVGRTYGIDHIAIVVKNTTNGQLELAESASKVGVRIKPLSQILPRYNKISKYGKYVGDFRSKIEPAAEETVTTTQTYKMTKQEIERSEVFSNFKVNKDCFNFFLRRQMNDDSLSTNVLKDLNVTPKK